MLNVTYAEMKKKIVMISGDPSGIDVGVEEVKEEVVLYNSERNSQRYQSNRRGGFRGRGCNMQRGSSKSSNNRNPVGNDGNVLRCYVCDSTKHLSPSCPHKKERDGNTVEEIHIVLLGSTPNEKQKQFVVEALGKGVLNSGCTKTVAGKDWMSEFIDTLSIKDKNCVSEKVVIPLFVLEMVLNAKA